MTPKQTRLSLGMSVAQFADALDTSPQTVRRWEMDPSKGGFRQPGKHLAWRIAHLVAKHMEALNER